MTVVTDSLGRSWDAKLHPRDRKGRFIRTFRKVRIFDVDGTSAWGTGTVSGFTPDGKINITLEKVRTDGSAKGKVGQKITVDSSNLESINERGDLAAARAAAAGGTKKASVPNANVTAANQSSGLAKLRANQEGKHGAGPIAFGLSLGFHPDSTQEAAKIMQGADPKSMPDGAYLVGLWAHNERQNGQISDQDFVESLDDLGVDPNLTDDSPDGLTGLKSLIDGYNSRHPSEWPDVVPFATRRERENASGARIGQGASLRTGKDDKKFVALDKYIVTKDGDKYKAEKWSRNEDGTNGKTVQEGAMIAHGDAPASTPEEPKADLNAPDPNAPDATPNADGVSVSDAPSTPADAPKPDAENRKVLADALRSAFPGDGTTTLQDNQKVNLPHGYSMEKDSNGNWSLYDGNDDGVEAFDLSEITPEKVSDSLFDDFNEKSKGPEDPFAGEDVPDPNADPTDDGKSVDDLLKENDQIVGDLPPEEDTTVKDRKTVADIPDGPDFTGPEKERQKAEADKADKAEKDKKDKADLKDALIKGAEENTRQRIADNEKRRAKLTPEQRQAEDDRLKPTVYRGDKTEPAPKTDSTDEGIPADQIPDVPDSEIDDASTPQELEAALDKKSASGEGDLLPMGEAPIPEGAYRFYHYTDLDNVDSIRDQGLLESHGRGDDASGTGPSAGVWASTKAPELNKGGHRAVVEFYLTKEQISQRAEAPGKLGQPEDPKEFMDGNHHIIANGDVPADQIVGIHEPWTEAYLDMKENPDPIEEYKWLKDKDPNDEYYAPYTKAYDKLVSEQGGSSDVNTPTSESTPQADAPEADLTPKLTALQRGQLEDSAYDWTDPQNSDTVKNAAQKFIDGKPLNIDDLRALEDLARSDGDNFDQPDNSKEDRAAGKRLKAAADRLKAAIDQHDSTNGGTNDRNNTGGDNTRGDSSNNGDSVPANSGTDSRLPANDGVARDANGDGTQTPGVQGDPSAGGGSSSTQLHLVGEDGKTRDITPIAVHTTPAARKDDLAGNGFSTPDLHELSPEDADVFRAAITKSKESNKFGASVHVYDLEGSDGEPGYKDMRLFMTSDGKSGIALKGDDIVSAFSSPDAENKKSVNSMMATAISLGGRRADSFDTILPHIYASEGMVAVARTKWDDQFAPDEWNKGTFGKFNGGEPDVVLYAYDPDKIGHIYEPDSAETFENWDDAAARVQSYLAGDKTLVPHNYPLTPTPTNETANFGLTTEQRRQVLENGIKSGIAKREPLTPLGFLNANGQVEKITFNDGSTAMLKNVDGETVDRNQMAEELIHALGGKSMVTTVYRDPDTQEDYLLGDIVPGGHMDEMAVMHEDPEFLSVRESPEGRAIGVADFLSAQGDRHSQNWILHPDGYPVAIDNDDAIFADQDGQYSDFGPEIWEADPDEVLAATASTKDFFDSIGMSEEHEYAMQRARDLKELQSRRAGNPPHKELEQPYGYDDDAINESLTDSELEKAYEHSPIAFGPEKKRRDRLKAVGADPTDHPAIGNSGNDNGNAVQAPSDSVDSGSEDPNSPSSQAKQIAENLRQQENAPESSGAQAIPEAPQAIFDKTEPVALPHEKYPPTRQQQDVIDAVNADLDVKVQAKAGSGKTSTLEALARRRQISHPDQQIIYVAFNSTVQKEADKRMPSNVESRTGHSIAYAWASKVKPRTLQRMRDGGLVNNREVADHLGIKSGVGDLDSKDVTKGVIESVGKFAYSAEDTLDDRHLSDMFADLTPEDRQKMLNLARAAWEDIKADDGKLKVTHDHYRKMWALSKPDLTNGTAGNKAAQVLFIDEAQDTPPVLAKVVADQNMQKVIVGDQDQAIYGFTGATDFLSVADADVELPLNKSWRFGPEVADAANRALQILGSDQRVVGGGPSSKIVKDMKDADAILTRSNGGMLGHIIEEMDRGRRVAVPKGTKQDIIKLINSAEALKFGRPQSKGDIHDDIAPYHSWEDLQKDALKGDAIAAKISNIFDTMDSTALKGYLRNLIDGDGSVGDDLLDSIERVNTPNGVQLQTPFTKDRSKKSAYDMFQEAGLKEDGWKYGETGVIAKAGKNKGKSKKGIFWAGPESEYTRAYNDAVQKIADHYGSDNSKPDVTITTAHKAKGLEWGRVKIGDDFKGPKKEEGSDKVVMPSDEELRLAYVALTRAETELDPGSLDYVYDYSDENGGVPKAKEPEHDDLKSRVEVAKEQLEDKIHAENRDPIDSVSSVPDGEDDILPEEENQTNVKQVPVPEDFDEDTGEVVPPEPREQAVKPTVPVPTPAERLRNSDPNRDLTPQENIRDNFLPENSDGSVRPTEGDRRPLPEGYEYSSKIDEDDPSMIDITLYDPNGDQVESTSILKNGGKFTSDDVADTLNDMINRDKSNKSEKDRQDQLDIAKAKKDAEEAQRTAPPVEPAAPSDDASPDEEAKVFRDLVGKPVKIDGGPFDGREGTLVRSTRNGDQWTHVVKVTGQNGTTGEFKVGKIVPNDSPNVPEPNQTPSEDRNAPEGLTPQDATPTESPRDLRRRIEDSMTNSELDEYDDLSRSERETYINSRAAGDSHETAMAKALGTYVEPVPEQTFDEKYPDLTGDESPEDVATKADELNKIFRETDPSDPEYSNIAKKTVDYLVQSKSNPAVTPAEDRNNNGVSEPVETPASERPNGIQERKDDIESDASTPASTDPTPPAPTPEPEPESFSKLTKAEKQNYQSGKRIRDAFKSGDDSALSPQELWWKVQLELTFKNDDGLSPDMLDDGENPKLTNLLKFMEDDQGPFRWWQKNGEAGTKMRIGDMAYQVIKDSDKAAAHRRGEGPPDVRYGRVVDMPTHSQPNITILAMDENGNLIPNDKEKDGWKRHRFHMERVSKFHGVDENGDPLDGPPDNGPNGGGPGPAPSTPPAPPEDSNTFPRSGELSDGYTYVASPVGEDEAQIEIFDPKGHGIGQVYNIGREYAQTPTLIEHALRDVLANHKEGKDLDAPRDHSDDPVDMREALKSGDLGAADSVAQARSLTTASYNIYPSDSNPDAPFIGRSFERSVVISPYVNEPTDVSKMFDLASDATNNFDDLEDGDIVNFGSKREAMFNKNEGGFDIFSDGEWAGFISTDQFKDKNTAVDRIVGSTDAAKPAPNANRGPFREVPFEEWSKPRKRDRLMDALLAESRRKNGTKAPAPPSKNKIVYRSGAHTVIFDHPLAESQRLRFVDEVEHTLREMEPFLGERGMRINVPKDKIKPQGLVQKLPPNATIQGLVYMSFPNTVYIDPNVAGYGSTKYGNVGGGQFQKMPAAEISAKMRYVLTHEFGHVMDGNHEHVWSQASPTEPYVVTPEATKFWESQKAQLSGYGKTNAYEGYAEAFAQWVLGGRGSSPVADAYAEFYGWPEPSTIDPSTPAIPTTAPVAGDVPIPAGAPAAPAAGGGPAV